MVTLLGFLALGLLAIGGRAAFGLLRESIDDRRQAKGRELGLQARKLDLEERALVVSEQRQRGPAVPKSIPPDLFRRITKWSDPIAQESERKILLDLYQEFRDEPDPWVEVRAHLPKEPSDEPAAEMFLQ